MTNDERAILSHVVVDPDAWWAHAQVWATAKYGKELGAATARLALTNKVAKWRPDAERDRMKPNYKTRAEREQRN